MQTATWLPCRPRRAAQMLLPSLHQLQARWQPQSSLLQSRQQCLAAVLSQATHWQPQRLLQETLLL